MMRVARLVLLVMALLPIAAFAEDGGPHRVGFVNVAEVLNKSPQVKKLESELKESYETRKAELDKEQEKLNELERKLATEGEGMSFDDRSTLEHQILSMRSKLKQELTWLEEDITIRKSGEISLYKLAISFNVYDYVEHRYSFLELAQIYDQLQHWRCKCSCQNVLA